MGHINKKAVVFASVGIILLFFLTRLTNILSIPIFTDEAIYVRWAQIAGNDAAWRFISLTDGKQPLFVWAAMLVMKVVSEPLLASRLVSVFAGLLTLIGMFFLTDELFRNKKMAFLSAFLYAIYPFALIYDRLALYDSMIGTFTVWALYMEVLLVRHRRLDLAFITGFIVGGGLLTKSSALFFLYLLPFSLLLLDSKKKQLKKDLLKWAGLAAVVLVISNAMYLILRLSPFFHIIEQKNYVFIYPFSEWIQHPVQFVLSNSSALLNWLTIYFTYPLLLLVPVSFLIGKKLWREKILLLVWFAAPFVALAFFGRTLYPRYILFMTLPLLVLASYSLWSLLTFVKKKYLKAAVFLVFTLSFLVNSYLVLTDLAKAYIPRSDKGQLLTSWPSGAGVRETVDYLKERSKEGKIFVGTGGTFGLMPYALEIYFVGDPNVTIKGYWPVKDVPPQDALEMAKKMPVYFVLYQECPGCPKAGVAPAGWPVKKIFDIRKGEPDTYYTLYQIVPR